MAYGFLCSDKESVITYFFQSEWVISLGSVCVVVLGTLNVVEAIVQMYKEPIVTLLKS